MEEGTSHVNLAEEEEVNAVVLGVVVVEKKTVVVGKEEEMESETQQNPMLTITAFPLSQQRHRQGHRHRLLL
jgi:response regulator RpfG family c-di-GMP phosphodiesterase